MKKRHHKLQFAKKMNKEFKEDLRLLQQKLRGGVSVYGNKLATYKRNPKHRQRSLAMQLLRNNIQTNHMYRGKGGTFQ